ncbi:hypothetical protein B0H34DRAFT_727733 [Crassisporium funariophilum]|nr:hypothetical protein B0H34DRAFT_727733 [Crassisporium funariophilum]
MDIQETEAAACTICQQGASALNGQTGAYRSHMACRSSESWCCVEESVACLDNENKLTYISNTSEFGIRHNQKLEFECNGYIEVDKARVVFAGCRKLELECTVTTSWSKGGSLLEAAKSSWDAPVMTTVNEGLTRYQWREGCPKIELGPRVNRTTSFR